MKSRVNIFKFASMSKDVELARRNFSTKRYSYLNLYDCLYSNSTKVIRPCKLPYSSRQVQIIWYHNFLKDMSIRSVLWASPLKICPFLLTSTHKLSLLVKGIFLKWALLTCFPSAEATGRYDRQMVEKRQLFPFRGKGVTSFASLQKLLFPPNGHLLQSSLACQLN